jgi:hypothetical protein
MMMVGAREWEALERLAIEAARQAVADLRAAYGEDAPMHPMTRIKAGHEPTRELQITRLALRLTGRAGTRNPLHTDRRWCALLGIDLPHR